MSLLLALKTRRWTQTLGGPGMAGAAVVAAGVVFYFSFLQPVQQRLEAARAMASPHQKQLALARVSLNDHARPVSEQLAAFYTLFPSEQEAADWVGRIAAIAGRSGLDLQQADYKVSRDRVGKLVRFEITVPLTGEYANIRKFLSDLRAEIPIVSLEEVGFERKKVGDPKVDAKVRLTVFLRGAR